MADDVVRERIMRYGQLVAWCLKDIFGIGNSYLLLVAAVVVFFRMRDNI